MCDKDQRSSWRVQYLLRLEADSCCAAPCKGPFMCEEDQCWLLLFVAGAVFGEVEASLFVAGAAFGEIWNNGPSAKCCIFQSKMLGASAKCNLACKAGCGLTVSCSDHGRIILGSATHCK